MKRYTKYSGYSTFSTRYQAKKTKNRLIITAIISMLFLYFAFFWLIPTIIGELSRLNNFKPSPIKQQSIADATTLAPPDLHIPYDATNTATINITGNASPHMLVEIYNNNSLVSKTEADGNGSFLSDSINLETGNNQIYGKTVDSNNHESLSSKDINITYDNTPPNLSITEPQDGTVITSGDKTIVVSGQTDSDGNTTVSINGIRVIVDDNGNFSQSVPLSDGDNTITIAATDEAGNMTQETKKVTYQSSDSTTPTPSPTPTPGQ